MKNTPLMFVIAAVLVGGAAFFVLNQQPAQPVPNSAAGGTMPAKGEPGYDESMMDDELIGGDAAPGDSMMDELKAGDDAMNPSAGQYTPYSEEAYAQAAGKKRVLFFHAAWCPTCKAANAAFLENPSAIPQNVVVFKTDYDTKTELKSKYGVTYQHTFVQVDDQGNEITKWNGGDITELQRRIK